MDTQLPTNPEPAINTFKQEKKSVPYLTVLAILVSVISLVFVLLQYNQIATLKEEVGKSKITDSISPGQVKVAYVNLDSINAKYEFIIEKSKELQASLESADKMLQQEIQTRQKEADELMYYMQNGNPSAEDKRVSEGRLMQLQNELAQIQQQEEKRLMDSETALQTDLHNRVSEYIARISKEQGWDYVFAYQQAAPLLMFGNPLYDLTGTVITGLNEEYTKSKQ
jgi:outer membrane protein